MKYKNEDLLFERSFLFLIFVNGALGCGLCGLVIGWAGRGWLRFVDIIDLPAMDYRIESDNDNEKTIVAHGN